MLFWGFHAKIGISGKIYGFQALATFTTYASYPALDCLSQNFVQCGQAITCLTLLNVFAKKLGLPLVPQKPEKKVA